MLNLIIITICVAKVGNVLAFKISKINNKGRVANAG